MKLFKLINDKLVQVPNDKEMPDATRYETDDDYCDALDKYYGTLPSYSLSPEMKEWVEKNPKDSYPESDFELKYERFIDGINKWVKCEKVEYDAISWQLHKTHRRIVAVPATDEKDEQDELWEEVGELTMTDNKMTWEQRKKSLKSKFHLSRITKND